MALMSDVRSRARRPEVSNIETVRGFQFPKVFIPLTKNAWSASAIMMVMPITSARAMEHRLHSHYIIYMPK